MFCVSCSSFIEREDWFYTLNHAVTEHTRGSEAFNSCSGEVSKLFSSVLICWVIITFSFYKSSSSISMWYSRFFFLCVCSRAGIVCGCLWERKLQRLFQSHKWWCAWTAPQTSASLFGDTTATAAEEWVTRKTNTVLLKHFNICETGCKIYFNVCLILSVVNLCCLMQIVCRSCSRNRYPLKYMKDRMAKVCDHCYNELKKRGGKTLHFWNLSSACFSVCLSYFWYCCPSCIHEKQFSLIVTTVITHYHTCQPWHLRNRISKPKCKSVVIHFHSFFVPDPRRVSVGASVQDAYNLLEYFFLFSFCLRVSHSVRRTRCILR